MISSVTLPDEPQFDKHFILKLTRKTTKKLFRERNLQIYTSQYDLRFLITKNKKATPTEFYSLEFRIVRFSASEDKDVTVVTNLAQSSYPAWKLYHLHLGIETAFRSLKHTLGLSNFHAKKQWRFFKKSTLNS